MRVKVRFLGVDIPPGVGPCEMELADGATVAEALAESVQRRDVGIPLVQLMESMFLVGSTAVRPDRVLCDGEKLSVIRTLAGG